MMPTTFREMEAWARLTGNEPTSLDVRVLMQLDALMLQPKKGKGK